MAALTRRDWLAGAVGFIVVGAAAFWFFRPRARRLATEIGGPFELVDADGAPFGFQDMQGRPSLVYFGFTRCPDICPTSLFQISEVLDRLGPQAEELNALFITVDPARDTPAQMKTYLSAFNSRLRGLTGDSAHLAIAWDIYGIDATIIPTTSDNYNMNHTSEIFVLDRNGRFSSTFDMHTSLDDAVEKLRYVLG